MGMGDSKGLGDPGVEGVLLKLAHPCRDTRGTSHKRASFHRLLHPQGIDDHLDNGLQKVMLVTLGPEDLSHFGKLLLQPGSSTLNIQPSIHRDAKICPEGVSHPTRLVALLDAPVAILMSCATL